MDATTDFQAVVMAAGKGTRLKSERPKVLHEVLGKPMVAYAVDAALGAGAQRVVVVLGWGRQRVRQYLQGHSDSERIHFAVQHDQLGTAHAVNAARQYFDDGPKYTAIISGDVPNMDAATLAEFIDRTVHAGHPLGMMTARVADPAQYGRVIRGPDAQVTGVVEFADATQKQRRIDEINAGFYAVDTDFLSRSLAQICAGAADNAQGEYYLTDLIAAAAQQVGAYGWQIDDVGLVQGVNTRQDLAAATRFARRRTNNAWMDAGVTFIDPETTYVEAGVELAEDVVLYPGVHLKGDTRIGARTIIENGSVVADTHIGADVRVKANCYLTQARVDDHTNLGPFAHLRPGADIGRGCKVGNFVEVKKSRLDDGVKAGHLSYLGDAHLGQKTNVGAGTITCNYDGQTKHRTDIGAGSFIGSNTALVAPVHLGEHAYVGAGSTVTADVPDDALAVARGRQRNIEQWAQSRQDDPDN